MAMRTIAESAWVGLSLAALFLYPLASALDGDPFYLQWQPQHSSEALVALVVLWVALTAAVALVRRLTGIAGAVGLAMVSGVPLASLAAGVSRQLPARGTLIGAWQRPGVAIACISAAALMLVGAMALRPERFRRSLWTLLLVLSPLTLVVATPFVRTALGTSGASAPREAREPSGPGCAPVLALLFDELSFAYVYEGGAIRADLPSLRRLAATATEHLAVTSPGPDTLVSVPGYLAARAVHGIAVSGDTMLEAREDGQFVPFEPGSPSGLFGQAQQLGFRTEMAGYYLPYCALLGTRLDRCRAFSFYNHATFGRGWSIVHPILTTLTLWPHQAPLGLLKNPAFAVQQRGLVEHAMAFAGEPVNRGLFRLVHFSIPHLPFVYDETGYHPPRDPLQTTPDTAYARQVRFTDRLLGELMQRLESARTFDGTTLVVLSDHGFRFGGRETDARHVPFIVKATGQHAPSTVATPERGETLLPQVLRSACGQAGSAEGETHRPSA